MGERATARLRYLILKDARERNSDKAGLLGIALGCELLAILVVAVSVVILLAS
jgi:hypothetical protein